MIWILRAASKYLAAALVVLDLNWQERIDFGGSPFFEDSSHTQGFLRSMVVNHKGYSDCFLDHSSVTVPQSLPNSVY